MGDAGKLRGDRIAAWTVVCIAHVALGWMLMRPPAPPRDAGATDSVLDVVWVVQAAKPPRVPPPQTAPASSGRSALRPVTQPADPAMEMPARDAATPATSPSMSAVFIQQAGEMAARHAPGSVQVDPFANRVVQLPGRAANTFRMRPAPSLAERVAKVGKLFGGADYETNPCRSVHDSINELSQAGDSRVLQDALDYERRFCH